MSIFSERLRDLRNSKGQTQGELGRMVGKSREAVSKYEMGDREPDPNVIADIARHFNVSADYILGITDDSSLVIGKNRRPFGPNLYAYEKYLEEIDFLPYLNLAVRIKDKNIELNIVEKFVDELIRKRTKNL